MPEESFRHKLAAILSADVVGYSRLMSEDEVATIRTLSAYRDKISTHVHENTGRVVDFIGDNMLAEFSSALDAVDCAVKIQKTLDGSNARLAENQQMHLRIGIDLGEILIDKDVIYGDGVNIASRLEGLADPGGICVSESIYNQVHNKLAIDFVDIGTKKLKNISTPVRVYKMVGPGIEAPPSVLEETINREIALPLPKKPSLAVLPFVNLSADSKHDYFSDGLTMDIMTALVRIPGLFLISEISMFSFKSKVPSVRELGRQLGVSHVLDGGVRKEGDRIRITARLLETATGRQIWAERYDRRIDDIFAVQDEITERIVEAMDVKLVTGEVAHTIRKAIRDPDALEYYYRGWEALFGSTKDDIKEAQRMFEETMRLEPGSSFGYAMAAWAHWWSVDQGLSEDIALSLERAIELARKAEELEDFTGLSHLVMAQIHLFKREHNKALEAVQEAVLARPSCDLSYIAKANILTYLSRPTEAIDLAKFAIRLAPVYPPFFQKTLAAAYYGSGRYEEAIESAREVLTSDRNNLDAFLILAAANAALNRQEEAFKAATEVKRIKPDFSIKRYVETQPYKDPKMLEQIASMLQRAGLN
ncbi:MAG: adenylate/guanylate cyclase domain-containing protein [Desulfobacterales bacterium]|nr:MAG: adenylate/guanylate cyclase domain-containing protein [Desulfobacterales bacterium]